VAGQYEKMALDVDTNGTKTLDEFTFSSVVYVPVLCLLWFFGFGLPRAGLIMLVC
jgi:hypothetical protein